jgi:hypothetical protein
MALFMSVCTPAFTTWNVIQIKSTPDSEGQLRVVLNKGNVARATADFWEINNITIVN